MAATFAGLLMLMLMPSAIVDQSVMGGMDG